MAHFCWNRCHTPCPFDGFKTGQNPEATNYRQVKPSAPFRGVMQKPPYSNATSKALQKIITSDTAFTETILQACCILYSYSPDKSDGHQIASARLLSLAEASHMPIDYFVYKIAKYDESLLDKIFSSGIIKQIEVILEQYPNLPEVLEPLDPPLWSLGLEPIELPDPVVKHKVDLAYRLTKSSHRYSSTEERKQAIKLLSEITSTVNFPVQSVIALLHEIMKYTFWKHTTAGEEIKGSMVSALQQANPEDLQEVMEAIDLLLQLTQRIIPPIVLTIEAAGLLYKFSPASSNEEQLAVKVLMNLANQSDLPIEQRRNAAYILCDNAYYGKDESKRAAQILLRLAQRVDPPDGETIAAAQDLYRSSYNYLPEENREAGQMLVQWMLRTDIASEHRIAAATGLVMGFYCELSKKHRSLIKQIIKQLISQDRIPVEKIVAIAPSLQFTRYTFNDPELFRLIENHLLNFARHGEATLRQKLDAIQILLSKRTYIVYQLQAVQLVFALLQKNVAICYLKEHWYTNLEELEKEEELNTLLSPIDNTIAPFIAELAQEERMPEEFRDYMYRKLSFFNTAHPSEIVTKSPL